MSTSFFRKKTNWLLMLSGLATVLLSVIVLIFVAFRWRTLDFLRLHYTAELGVDWIDSWWYIFLFPGLAISTLLINIALSILLRQHNPVFAQMIGIATLMLEIAFLVAGVLVLLLNV